MPSATPTLPATDTDTAAQLRAVIGRLARRLRPTAAGVAAGLTPTRITVLLHVVRRGPIRLSEVAAAEGINPTMLSRVISELAADGLVARDCDERDRRAVWLRPTGAGRRLAERIRRERTEAINAALGDLDPGARNAVVAALPALEALAGALGAPR